ncbi:PHD-finger domain-containing protein 3 [Elsinoe fawcettii]|nr:PHD-finger domain-containing protein 3 [Elsinoe fawcettii]
MPSAVGKGKPRSSRLSSPQVRNGTPVARESLSGWSEPTLKDARASFEDHGGMPFGVLEDMQPLGQRPSSKVKTRVKAEPLRKSIGKSLGNKQEYTVTPEGTPPVETPRSTSVVPQEEVAAALVPIPTMEKDADDDYMPHVGKKAAKVSRRTRGSSGISDIVKTASPSVAPIPPTSVQTSTPTPAPARVVPAPDMSDQEMERVNFELVVNSAEKRARSLGSEAFGAALRQVYLEARTNDHYVHLLRAVLMQTATDEDKADFTTAIKKAKRTLRRTQPSRPLSDVDSSVIDHTPKSKSRNLQAARPSIETNKPSIRLNFARGQLAAEGSDAEGGRSLRRTRSREKSLSAPLTPVPADIDMQDPPHHDELVNAAIDNGDGLDGQIESDDLASAGTLHTATDTPDPIVPDDTASLAVFNGVHDGNSDDGTSGAGDHRAPKRSPLEAGFDQTTIDVIEHTKRRKLNETLYKDPPKKDVEESHIRDSTEATRSLRHRDNAVNYRPTLKLTNGTPNTRQKRGGRDPSDSPLSDMSMSPPPVINPPTDVAANRNKKKAKTKQSPEKKQYPAPDERGLRGASLGPYDDEEESDNNDYCNACGGTGYLLCCDGCDRAFHFNCVDPPLDVNSSALDEPWFCHTCIAKKNPPARQPRGLFAGLLQGLEKRNPSIYTLPSSLQTYFVGTGVGKDGKFDDLAAQKARNTRAGYDEPLDTLKVKDNKGNNILCFHCGRSAAGKREIITCDICGNHWHLDCTNPPLANPPFRDQYNRKAREWMCPLHVEHDLSAIDPIRLARRRKVHLRRPRNARIVDTALRRGIANNGQIEVIDDTSSAEDTEFDDDETASGTVIRVPSKGIKLDFIDKVQRVRSLEDGEAYLPPAKRTRIDSRVLRAELNSRAITERQAALELVQFASQQNDISIAPESVENLIYTLTAEAPKEVVDQIAGDEDERNLTNGLASPPSSDGSGVAASLTRKQRKDLEALQELIKRRLESAAAGNV